VAWAFAEANTVAWFLNQARFSPEYRELMRGADIYVDEASLLDNQTMLGLVTLARGIDARVIFQGDTKQLQAVGRGQPLAMLERELGFGMHVGRIDVTRRQLKMEDKRLSRELSSGDAARFCTAMERLIERGSIMRCKPFSLTETQLSRWRRLCYRLLTGWLRKFPINSMRRTRKPCRKCRWLKLRR